MAMLFVFGLLALVPPPGAVRSSWMGRAGPVLAAEPRRSVGGGRRARVRAAVREAAGLASPRRLVRWMRSRAQPVRALPRSSTQLCVAHGSAVRHFATANDELYELFNYPRSYFYASLSETASLETPQPSVGERSAGERVRWLRPLVLRHPYGAADRTLDHARLAFLRELRKTVRDARNRGGSKGVRWSKKPRR